MAYRPLNPRPKEEPVTQPRVLILCAEPLLTVAAAVEIANGVPVSVAQDTTTALKLIRREHTTLLVVCTEYGELPGLTAFVRSVKAWIYPGNVIAVSDDRAIRRELVKAGCDRQCGVNGLAESVKEIHRLSFDRL